ncbi:MAG: hypothetical protein HY907_01000 [Deltaproteobacteria bacterium]|nr:hypothetical protein [Deltaproteobacteria bacterium]
MRAGGIPGRAGRAVAALFARLWRLLLTFLEVIGLRRGDRRETSAQLVRFKQCYAEFRTLLGANHDFLEGMTDLEQKLLRAEPVDPAFVKRTAVRLVADVHRMQASLNAIAQGRYPALPGRLDAIGAALHARLGEESAGTERGGALVVPLAGLGAGDGASAGGKMANLGEVRNNVGLPTPDGFAVTAEACRLLFRENGIDDLVEKEYQGLSCAGASDELSGRIRRRVLGATVPEPLRAAIAEAYGDLCRRCGRTVRVAVRSSAPGEDTEMSFAGQFATVLGVGEADLLPAYLEVVASLHAPGAVHYRTAMCALSDTATMAVGFVAMVDAAAAGVAYSVDPSRADARDVLVHAVHGLGSSLVDGSVPAEALRVSAREPHPGVRRESGAGGEPCLADAEAVELARLALVLEAHFGCPQDVEWALDRERRPFILQSRPLRLAAGASEETPPLPGHVVLLAGGEVACPGVGSGPVVHLDENGDLDGFPAGGVLVAKRSSPRFVRALTRAAAVVTDVGGTTGHMASLARELRVPALLGAREATARLAPGTIVTVDAARRRVYEGLVPGLEAKGAEGRAAAAREARVRASPTFRLLERVAEVVVPLRLSDPRSPDFTIAECRTLHDVARYIHEKSYEEMFGMGAELGDFRAASYKLDVFLPIDLYVVDLGGGLAPPSHGRTVKRRHITSVPLAALLGGMLDPGIPRFGPRPIDVKGLLSIMARHAMENPEEERTFRDPCYAIVSDRYLNYAARVGYHFSAVDTYCGLTADKNYISFRFHGGAADEARRSRRVAAIAAILREHGFSVESRGDLVTARFSKADREKIRAHLDVLGRLLQFMRQLDVAMVDDGMVDQVVRAFLAGKYRL